MDRPTNDEAGALLTTQDESTSQEKPGMLTTIKPSDSSNLSFRGRNATAGAGTVLSKESLPLSAINGNVPERNLPSVRRLSALDRVGKFAIWTFLLGTVLILATIGFLSFLWFANYFNGTWQRIIVYNWLTKLVTICSLIIRHAADFQAAACVAMLAGLMLERSGVSLPSSASVSMLRAQPGSGKIFDLLVALRKPIRSNHGGLISTFALASVLALTTVLIQLVSFTLISDIALGLTLGINSTSDVAYAHDWDRANFDSVSQPSTYDTTWVRKPPSFTTFAEYTESPFLHESVVDTGVTLRAFLPVALTQSRESLRSFSGRATVVDTRVTCQSPILQNEYVESIDELWSLNLTGQIWPTVSTPKFNNATPVYANKLGELQNNTGVWFSCFAASEDLASYGTSDEWKLSICQLEDGGLISEFEDSATYSEQPLKYTTAFLVLNFTAGKFLDWYYLNNSGYEIGIVKPQRKDVRGEWLDLVYGPSILSISLCYSGFSAADMLVNAYSSSNRTEPTESFDFVKAIYTYDSVRKQLGQAKHSALSYDSRGVLALARKSSWLADVSGDPGDAAVESPIQDFANMGGAFGEGNSANFTALLWLASTMGSPDLATSSSYNLITPHHSHVLLFQEIIQNGGSIAFAIQSLLTIMASMTYYDHLPTFSITGEAEQSFFVIANTPARYRGFVIVVVVLTLHLCVCATITTLFVLQTQYTELGNHWQALGQVISPETEEILAIASVTSGKAIDQKIVDGGQSKAGVVLKRWDGRVGLFPTN